MNSRSTVIALVAMLCVAAAGGGAYLAVRDNRTTPAAELAALPPAGAVSEPAAAAAAPSSATDTVVPVTDDEAVAAKTAAAAKDPEPKASNGGELPRPATARARRTAPAREASASSSAPIPRPIEQPSTAPAPEHAQPQAAPASEPLSETVTPVERVPEREAPPARTIEQLVVETDSVIGLQMETTLTTERARVEDRVEARVTRDVTVGDRAAIPAGARMIGSVSLVEQGGKVRERARLGVRFHTLVLADGTTVPVQTDTIFRDGESPAGSSAAKIGGAAVGGAILGAIFGGGKGAIIGGSTGAAGGTAAVMAGDRKPAVLQAGTSVTVRLSAPVTVTVEREQEPRL
jgi:type IV secretory pathway VirB10-like protein